MRKRSEVVAAVTAARWFDVNVAGTWAGRLFESGRSDIGMTSC